MAELRAPEAPRDHASLDKALKKIDKSYYTDDLLGQLTLNDKQYAWTTANVPDEPAGEEEYDNGGPRPDADILNPTERDGEDGERVVEPYYEPAAVVTPGPVASEEEVNSREEVESSPVLPEVTAEDEQAAAAEAEDDGEVEADEEESASTEDEDEEV